jgi:hypothetical protein
MSVGDVVARACDALPSFLAPLPAEVFLRHTPIIGLALAAAAALASEPAAPGGRCFWPSWERLGALERQLLLALPEGSEGSGMLQPMLLEAIASSQQVGMHQQQACWATAYMG